jgi:3-hydroxybutyryl-CoA dehydratase
VIPLRKGDERALTVDLTESMVQAFTEWSGDHAPLHTNDDFSRQAGFAKRIVHGAVLFSLISRFVGMHFPGPQSLWLKSEVKFHHPCYAPNTLTITGRVVSVSEAIASVMLDIDITNSDGLKIASARNYHKIME